MPSKSYSQAWSETKAHVREARQRVQRGEFLCWLRQRTCNQRWKNLKECGGQYTLIATLVLVLSAIIDILARHFAPYDETAIALIAVSAVVFLPFLAVLASAVCMKLANRVAYENGYPFLALSYRLLFIVLAVFLVVMAIDSVYNPIFHHEFKQFSELLCGYF